MAHLSELRSPVLVNYARFEIFEKTMSLSPQLLNDIAKHLFTRLNGDAQSLRSPEAIASLLRSHVSLPQNKNKLLHRSTADASSRSSSESFVDDVGDLEGSSMSRSSSGLSRSSSGLTRSPSDLSLISSPFGKVAVDESLQDSSDDEEAEYDDCYDAITDKKRGRIKYPSTDKAIVNAPVMELIDSKLLAPQKSPLFQCSRTKDGALCERASLVFPYLKKILKPIIRSLAAKKKHLKKKADGKNLLVQRYFWCAYDLVRKRRANHVQEWRLYGCPMDLIYGGREEFEAIHGDPWATSKRKKKSVNGGAS